MCACECKECREPTPYIDAAWQALSLQAAERYAAATFDWLYIDALHTYEAVLR